MGLWMPHFFWRIKMTIVKLDESNFNDTISTGTVLVDFYADWCGPCKRMLPTLDSVATKLDGKVTVAKVNIDESPNLSQKYEIRSIPALFVFKDGSVVSETRGSKTEAQLLELLGEQAGV